MIRKVKEKSSIVFLFFSLVTVIFLQQFLIGCGKKKDAGNSPLFVLEQMKGVAEKGDIKALGNFFCEKDRKKLETASSLGELVLGSRGKIVIDFIKKHLRKEQEIDLDNFVFKNENITGNTATVDAFNQKKEKTKTFHFIRENDQWKMCKP